MTLRARRSAAFLRSAQVFVRLRDAFARASKGAFRLVHFSVQRDHVHMLVEAADGASLRSGMQGLTTRLARAVNRALGRRGPVWNGRYHRRDLASPSEVRATLLYVLQNWKKHGLVSPGHGALDPMSSAAHLLGWNARGEALRAADLARSAPPFGGDRVHAVVSPLTWLLRVGWNLRGGGALDAREAPRSRVSGGRSTHEAS